MSEESPGSREVLAALREILNYIGGWDLKDPNHPIVKTRELMERMERLERLERKGPQMLAALKQAQFAFGFGSSATPEQQQQAAEAITKAILAAEGTS
jgi:hypothetical protein